MKIKIKEIGDSLGILLNQEILSKLKVKAGDTVQVVETQNGIQILPCDSKSDEELDERPSLKSLLMGENVPSFEGLDLERE